MTMTLNLPSKLSEYVTSQVAQGYFTNPEEVICDAVRHHAGMEMEDDAELEAALLAGVRSPRRPLTEEVWDSIRSRASALASNHESSTRNL